MKRQPINWAFWWKMRCRKLFRQNETLVALVDVQEQQLTLTRKKAERLENTIANLRTRNEKLLESLRLPSIDVDD